MCEREGTREGECLKEMVSVCEREVKCLERLLVCDREREREVSDWRDG